MRSSKFNQNIMWNWNTSVFNLRASNLKGTGWSTVYPLNSTSYKSLKFGKPLYCLKVNVEIHV